MNAEKNEGWGCLARGCLFFAIVAFIMAGFFAWGAYSIYKHAYALTSDGPVTLPVYEGSGYPGVRQRVNDFQAATDAGKPATLTLSAEDMNAMVAIDPGFSHARGRVYFDIQGKDLIVQVSIPLDGVRWMENRWLNATLTIEPKIESGRLTLIPKAIKAGEHDAPLEMIKTLQAFSWNDYISQNPEMSKILAKVKSLRIENGSLIIESQ